MYYKNGFRLQASLFIVLAMILSPTAVAKDRSAIPTQAQTVGAQASGVDVSLEQVSGGKALTTKTDERGSFTFSNVAPGSYKLRIGCAKTGAISPDVAGQSEPEKGRDVQRGVQRCYAEFRIEITDQSTGVITGAIRREGDRK